MPPWTLVSPASRGIGFALARRVLETTNAPLVVTARKELAQTKRDMLRGLNVDESRLTMLELDYRGMHLSSPVPLKSTPNQLTPADESTMAAAAKVCREKFPHPENILQMAFIVPGVLYPEKKLGIVYGDDALLTYQVNSLGPTLMMKYFEPFLASKAKHLSGENKDEMKGLPSVSTMAVMSARVGSISDNKTGGWYTYRASKAAVNSLVKSVDNHLKIRSGDKAMIVSLHPGTVKTDFSKAFWHGVKRGKLFEKEDAAANLINVVKKMPLSGRGKCWDYDGKEIPP